MLNVLPDSSNKFAFKDLDRILAVFIIWSKASTLSIETGKFKKGGIISIEEMTQPINAQR